MGAAVRAAEKAVCRGGAIKTGVQQAGFPRFLDAGKTIFRSLFYLLC